MDISPLETSNMFYTENIKINNQRKCKGFVLFKAGWGHHEEVLAVRVQHSAWIWEQIYSIEYTTWYTIILFLSILYYDTQAVLILYNNKSGDLML